LPTTDNSTHCASISKYRKDILSARDEVPYSLLQQKLDGVDESLTFPRMAGDAVIAAFFSADKPRDRENARILRREQTEAVLKNPSDTQAADAVELAIAKLSRGSKGITPFHWELEFPEVFTFGADGITNGGFDGIVGNPPFLAGGDISTSFGSHYLGWLKEMHPDADGGADLVSYFFRLGFRIVNSRGCCGFIATNTISQGETRRASLSYICANNGYIHSATKRLRWPGRAAVVVSVVHFRKNPGVQQVAVQLDDAPVSRISSFLLPSREDDDPKTLAANRGLAFGGAKIYGQGFILTPSEKETLCVSNAAKCRAYYALFGR
jgi:hypothetical protein